MKKKIVFLIFLVSGFTTYAVTVSFSTGTAIYSTFENSSGLSFSLADKTYRPFVHERNLIRIKRAEKMLIAFIVFDF